MSAAYSEISSIIFDLKHDIEDWQTYISIHQTPFRLKAYGEYIRLFYTTDYKPLQLFLRYPYIQEYQKYHLVELSHATSPIPTASSFPGL